MTRVRLPDTPIPSAERHLRKLDGPVAELVGLLVSRNNGAAVLEQAEGLLVRCPEVIVVDQGSTDDTVQQLESGGLRVLRLPAAHGEGAALRVGMQLARELGYIGALLPGLDVLSAEDLDVLALAHMRAPEAMFMAVGPGEAVAGQEWVEAAMLAEGLEPPPLSDFRPPLSEGLPGRAERVFEKLVETRYAYPWGSPRVLPLQAMLRRDLQCSGLDFHMECLFLGSLAGIPTIEVELATPPQRRVLTCRKTASRLLVRMLALLARKRLSERLGMGGGYAPPTTSPLGLLLAVGLVVATAAPASGCVRQVTTAQAVEVACETVLPRLSWPAGGDAEVAQRLEQESRDRRGTLWMQQTVTLDEAGPAPRQQLQGTLILDGEDRLRLRLLAPMGLMALDFVSSGQDWQLTVPSLQLQERGDGALPSSFEDSRGRKVPMRVDLLASVLRGGVRGAAVRWQPGACAVLEELSESGQVLRRLGYEQTEGGWRLAREELLEDDTALLVASYSDYREVGEAASWPHRLELRDPQRGSVALFETSLVRTDGVSDELFALVEMSAAGTAKKE